MNIIRSLSSVFTNNYYDNLNSQKKWNSEPNVETNNINNDTNSLDTQKKEILSFPSVYSLTSNFYSDDNIVNYGIDNLHNDFEYVDDIPEPEITYSLEPNHYSKAAGGKNRNLKKRS